MILKLLLNIIMFIIQLIIKTFLIFIPDMPIQGTITTSLEVLTGILTQAKNFLYFIIGEPFYIIIDLLASYITFKLVIYPIILLIRRNLTKTE